MKTIQQLQQELAKHRKLLHRAVGNQIIPHIDFHHYECVRLIREINIANEKEYMDNLGKIGLIGAEAGNNLFKMLTEQLLKAEDEAILKGSNPKQ